MPECSQHQHLTLRSIQFRQRHSHHFFTMRHHRVLRRHHLVHNRQRSQPVCSPTTSRRTPPMIRHHEAGRACQPHPLPHDIEPGQLIEAFVGQHEHVSAHLFDIRRVALRARKRSTHHPLVRANESSEPVAVITLLVGHITSYSCTTRRI